MSEELITGPDAKEVFCNYAGSKVWGYKCKDNYYNIFKEGKEIYKGKCKDKAMEIMDSSEF